MLTSQVRLLPPVALRGPGHGLMALVSTDLSDTPRSPYAPALRHGQCHGTPFLSPGRFEPPQKGQEAAQYVIPAHR